MLVGLAGMGRRGVKIAVLDPDAGTNGLRRLLGS